MLWEDVGDILLGTGTGETLRGGVRGVFMPGSATAASSLMVLTGLQPFIELQLIICWLLQIPFPSEYALLLFVAANE